MAVPKKRMSKAKTDIRKKVWKNKVQKNATRALSVAKYVLYSILKEVPKTENSDSDTYKKNQP
jgi:ribosomal protein L32